MYSFAFRIILAHYRHPEWVYANRQLYDSKIKKEKEKQKKTWKGSKRNANKITSIILSVFLFNWTTIAKPSHSTQTREKGYSTSRHENSCFHHIFSPKAGRFSNILKRIIQIIFCFSGWGNPRTNPSFWPNEREVKWRTDKTPPSPPPAQLRITFAV